MAKDNKTYQIFIINPGSTSTKLSLFENENNLFTTDVFHDSSELKQFPTINDQLGYRMDVVKKFLADNQIDLSNIDAIVGRGGGCCPVPSGIYRIDKRLIEDTKAARGGVRHASMLGVQMADILCQHYGGQMFMIDPPVVDELWDLARITGVDGIYRTTGSHALNLKATARRHASLIGKKYEECNFIACHIDGGISITAHHKGRMVDGNNAGGGEGPFTPTRMGSMAVTDLLYHFKPEDLGRLKSLCSQTGGLSSYFGTSNSDTVHKMVENGDPKATLIWNAMVYQIIKWIGSMATVLKGQVDGILLTGGLLRFSDVENQIRESCQWIAPVTSYVGEFEQEAMAEGALRVLRGEEEARQYPGKPVWEGFSFT
ncbi:MAG: butyrate kinase [Lachnospiraceae bacterium]|nr:butyrate kinase [Lachnospiraceae bacterium]